MIPRSGSLAPFAVLAVLAALASVEAATPDAFDTAFRFATAIEADPNDQAMAQERVVTDLVALGRLEEAGDRAAKIKGWRRGTACADIARSWAERGRSDEARKYLDQAEAARRAATDWGGPRIAAHMAGALAVLGDVERTTSLVEQIARDDPRQYGGLAAAAVAGGLAQTGDFAGAMSRLRALDEDRDFDVAWWRTTGYRDLARRPDLTAAERSEALRAARGSADGVSGWKRGEALVDIAREYLRRDDRPAAREALLAAEEVVSPLPPTLPVKASLMSELAATWGLHKDTSRARRLLQRAEKEAPATAVIDRPGALAAIAGARWAVGDHAAAESLYARALTEAEALVNARPRALAVVDICLSLGRNGAAVTPEVRTRLHALFAGLRDPW
jgi:tetratricopeptide (TPR) repeat protein